MISQTLEYVCQGLNLSEAHAFDVMNSIMAGDWTPSQISGLLMGLKIKGETVPEISGFVKAMRHHALKVAAPVNAVDTCGTGGDGLHSFNISTAAAFIAAAEGVTIAKHGNRSVSSKCGSADVLNTLGAKIDLSPEEAEQCLKKTGMAFLFAPVYHASMKHAVVPRRELGVRTVFNILGPMSNPALTKRQVIGAFNLETAEKMVQVLQKNGSEHVMVVHSTDGMDEISLSAPTHVFELKDDSISHYQIKPDDFGITPAPMDTIRGGNAEENADTMRRVFQGESSPIADIISLNAGAAIYVAGRTQNLADGVKQAREILKSGAAAEKLDAFIACTNTLNQN